MKPIRLAALAALLFCTIPARAGDNGSIETSVASSNVDAGADATDGNGTAYQVSWVRPLSKLGMLAGRLDMARIDGVGDGNVGAWNVALGAQLQLGDASDADGDPVGAFQGFLRGSLGLTFQDAVEMTEEVPVEPAAPSLHHPAALAQAVEVPITISEQYVTAAVGAGFRVFANAERTIGFGSELGYQLPLNADVLVDNAVTVRAFLIIPAGGN